LSGQRSEATIEIAATPQAVFEWIADPRRAGEWMQTSVEWLPEDRAELRAGYRGTETLDLPGGPEDCEFELVAYEPARVFATRNRTSAYEATAWMELTDLGGRTRVEGWTETEYVGRTNALARIPGTGRLLALAQRKAHRQSMERLKALVESRADPLATGGVGSA
jgi:uncharacterized protein YndB with AHSA1/START domain